MNTHITRVILDATWVTPKTYRVHIWPSNDCVKKGTRKECMRYIETHYPNARFEDDSGDDR